MSRIQSSAGKRIVVEIPADLHDRVVKEKIRSGASIRFQVISALEAALQATDADTQNSEKVGPEVTADPAPADKEKVDNEDEPERHKAEYPEFDTLTLEQVFALLKIAMREHVYGGAHEVRALRLHRMINSSGRVSREGYRFINAMLITPLRDGGGGRSSMTGTMADHVGKSLREVERGLVRATYKQSMGNVAQTSQIVGITEYRVKRIIEMDYKADD